MARLLPPGEFERLRTIARPLLDECREAVKGKTILPPHAKPEERPLYDLVQALTLAIETVVVESALDEGPAMIGMGAATGMVLAHCFHRHAELLALLRRQEAETYDEVRKAATPPTSTMQ